MYACTYIEEYNTMQWCVAERNDKSYYFNEMWCHAIALYCIVLYSHGIYSIVLCCIALHCTLLWWHVLVIKWPITWCHVFVLHWIALHRTTVQPLDCSPIASTRDRGHDWTGDGMRFSTRVKGLILQRDIGQVSVEDAPRLGTEGASRLATEGASALTRRRARLDKGRITTWTDW